MVCSIYAHYNVIKTNGREKGAFLSRSAKVCAGKELTVSILYGAKYVLEFFFFSNSQTPGGIQKFFPGSF